MSWLAALERVLLVAWVGSLWSVGFVVAPLLFNVLDDPGLAGAIAGQLFTIEAYLGLLCGGALLVLSSLGEEGRGPGIWLISIMLVLIALGEFGLRPFMESARSHGTAVGFFFEHLHQIAVALYIVESALAFWLVVIGGTRMTVAIRGD